MAPSQNINRLHVINEVKEAWNRPTRAGQCPSAIVSRATSLQSWWPNAPRALLWVGPAGEKQESRFAELDAAAARAAGPRQRRGSTRPVGKSGSRRCAVRSGTGVQAGRGPPSRNRTGEER